MYSGFLVLEAEENLMSLGEEFLNPGCQCCEKEVVGFVQLFI